MKYYSHMPRAFPVVPYPKGLPRCPLLFHFKVDREAPSLREQRLESAVVEDALAESLKTNGAYMMLWKRLLVQENLDSYVTDTLFGGDKGASRLPGLVEAVRKIRSMAKAVEPPPRDRIRPLEKKLERCRTAIREEEARKGRGKKGEDFVDEDDMLRAAVDERSGRLS